MFGKKYEDKDFEDFRRYEEYQRRKNEAVVKGVGGFLGNLILRWFILVGTYFVLSTIVSNLTSLSEAVVMISTFILSFLVFKLRYVKEYPVKSLITICFLIFLVFVVFYS